MRVFGLISLMPVVALLGCASPVSYVATETIDASFASGGGQFDSGPSIHVVAKAKEISGRVGACAIWATQGGNAGVESEFDAAAQGVELWLADNMLVSDVVRFPQVGFKDDMNGVAASCMDTGLAWTEAYADHQIRIEVRNYQRRQSCGIAISFGRASLPSLVA